MDLPKKGEEVSFERLSRFVIVTGSVAFGRKSRKILHPNPLRAMDARFGLIVGGVSASIQRAFCTI